MSLNSLKHCRSDIQIVLKFLGLSMSYVELKDDIYKVVQHYFH